MTRCQPFTGAANRAPDGTRLRRAMGQPLERLICAVKASQVIPYPRVSWHDNDAVTSGGIEQLGFVTFHLLVEEG